MHPDIDLVLLLFRTSRSIRFRAGISDVIGMFRDLRIWGSRPPVVFVAEYPILVSESPNQSEVPKSGNIGFSGCCSFLTGMSGVGIGVSDMGLGEQTVT